MPFDSKSWNLPKSEGLYNPTLEKDACGVGFIVNIEGKSSHQVKFTCKCSPLYLANSEGISLKKKFILLKIVQDAAKFSKRMEHRGACSADNATGDGAGTLVALPHEFYEDELR